MLDRVSLMPRVWNALRWIVEAGFQGEHAVIDRELAPFRDHQRRFLDFGCGTGEFAQDFPADRYVGIDLTPEYVRYARERRAGSYSVMNGSSLALEAGSFDAALVLGVLHHLPDPLVQASVGEIHRVLKPEATLLVLEDVPPPTLWNVPGHVMHWLDRGGYIRSDSDYRALFAPHFAVARSYHMRSGICDYGVYVLQRQHLDT